MMKNSISVEQNRYYPLFLALNQRCTEGSGLFYAIFFAPILYYWGKAGGLQIPAVGRIFDPRCQGFAVAYTTALHPRRLPVPLGFCGEL
jgi:hypothetical protein